MKVIYKGGTRFFHFALLLSHVTAVEPLSKLFIKMFLVISSVIKWTPLFPNKTAVFTLRNFNVHKLFCETIQIYFNCSIFIFRITSVFWFNLLRSNSFSSSQKCHFNWNILSYASSSILSFVFLTLLLVGANFNPLEINEISTWASFPLFKSTTFLLANVPLICPFKVNMSLYFSFKWLSLLSLFI